MTKKIILVSLIFVVVGVFYFSWLSDPSLESETYLPQWLLNWSNEYYNLRTAIPFVALGFLLEAYTNRKKSYDTNPNRNLSFMQNLGISAVIAFIAEGGQFLIKSRNPDVMDIYFAIVGGLLGGLGYNLLSILVNFKRVRNAE
ncbi:VanZ family protein [Flavobacterium sp. N3904]|uniref:VanZ family protein n=1 Tax=Flavobacterium sp. N3904 TaxID=2986835 RepID=UPI0022248E7D|nr:VanZ family protein [Flavobacterium sp. N3904]